MFCTKKVTLKLSLSFLHIKCDQNFLHEKVIFFLYCSLIFNCVFWHNFSSLCAENVSSSIFSILLKRIETSRHVETYVYLLKTRFKNSAQRFYFFWTGALEIFSQIFSLRPKDLAEIFYGASKYNSKFELHSFSLFCCTGFRMELCDFGFPMMIAIFLQQLFQNNFQQRMM
jgi:hypothetical protein